MKPVAGGGRGKAKNRGARAGTDRRAVLPARRDLRQPLALTALCALTALAFSNSFASGFILDNKGLLLDPRLREATAANIGLIFQHTYWWPTGESGLYRPLTTLTYLFNYAVAGDRDQPGGYHWVNLILHLGNVLLAFAAGRRLLGDFRRSFFAAALWSVHPVLTESVTNIVGRADLLAGMAVLSGFWMYLKSAEDAADSRVWLAGLAAVTTLGVFSKESAVAIFPVIALYELAWPKQRQWNRFAWGCAATLTPIVAMLVQRARVLAASPPAEVPFTDNPIAGADWWMGRVTAIKVAAHYIGLVIWPAKLSCDYSYNQIPLARGGAAVWLALVAVCAAAGIAVLLLRWNRAGFFLAGFAFLNSLPASNLLFPTGTIMAERLLYLPSLGLVGCLVLAVGGLARAGKLAVVPPLLLSLIASAFAVRTWVRNRDWRSELAIASADVRVSPDSFKLHRLLAASLFESDRSHSNIDQVIVEQRKSLALIQSLPDALSRPEVYRMAGYYDLVKSRRSSRKPDPELYRHAIRSLERAISIDDAVRAKYRETDRAGRARRPEGDSQAYLLLSVAYLESGDAAGALTPALRAMALDPVNPQIYRQISAIFAAKGDRAEAEAAAAVEDAIAAVDRGGWEEAAALSERLLESHPARYPVVFYLNAMANLKLGKLDAAENSVRTAVRLDRAGTNPRDKYILGLILARRRQFHESAELLKAYLEAAPDAADVEAVQRQLREIESMIR